jgi:hypothetical protein
MMELLILLGCVVASAGMAYAIYRLKRRRRDALANMATQLGLSFSAWDQRALRDLPLELLHRGPSRAIENVLWGTWQGVEVWAFDYAYDEESSRPHGQPSGTSARLSCAITEIEAACSPLRIERERLGSRISGPLGGDDVDFESDEFNRSFRIVCGDRKFAYDLIDARMMSWLLSTPDIFEFEVGGKWLLTFTPRVRPTELVPLLGTAKLFHEHVPRVVSSLYGLRDAG